MAKKFEQVVIPVMVTIQKPVGSKWSDQDVVNVLKVKSTSLQDVKVKSWSAAEQAPA